jgi:parallel beta-helix repeat protein
MGNTSSKKYLAIGILCLFIGASILPIVSGADQNLIQTKEHGRHAAASPGDNVKLDTPHSSTVKAKASVTKLDHEQPQKASSIKDKNDIVFQTFPFVQLKDDTPQPLGGSVHNLNSGEVFDTIQEAVDDAQTLAGHTIVIDAGVYQENVIVNKAVTIRGNNESSMPVIDGMMGVCFNISVNSVSLKWLNMTNATCAIYCSAAGFSLLNNEFYYNTWGMVWVDQKFNLTSSQTLPASIIKYNRFYSDFSDEYAELYADQIYGVIDLEYLYTGSYTVSIGAITITDNTFFLNESTLADAIDFDFVGVYNLSGGSITVGNINVSANTIYGGNEGLDFSGDFWHLRNVQVTVGDFIVTNNIMINQDNDGISIDYFDAEDWSGTTHGVFGILLITENLIQSQNGGDGIGIWDYGNWYNYTNTASLHVGDMIIQNNDVNVTGTGISFEMYEIGDGDDYPIADSASITLGDFKIIDNTITSVNDDGIYIDADYLGAYMYDYATFSMGDLLINDNTIIATSYNYSSVTDNISDAVHLTRGNTQGIYNAVTETHYTHYSSPDDTQWSDIYETPQADPVNLSYADWEDAVDANPPDMVGNVIYMHIISENRFFQMNFTSWQEGGGGGFSYTRYELVNGTVAAGVDFTRPYGGNGGDGIYVSDLYDVGYEIHDHSSVSIGDIQFNGNIINASAYGLDLSWIGDFGEDMDGQARCTVGDITADRNTILSTGDYGIWFTYGYFGYSLGEETASSHCVFTMGDITFNENNITSYSTGICSYDMSYDDGIYDIGEDLYGSSTVTIGDIQFNDNLINSTENEGIYIDYVEYLGYYLYGSAQFTMGNFEMCRNNIYAGDSDGIYVYFEEIGYELEGTSKCVFGDFLFNDNTIVSPNDDGLVLDSFYYMGYDLEDTSSVTIGNIEALNNTITCYDYGIYCEFYEIGEDMDDSSVCNVGDVLFNENDVNASDYYGIYLENYYLGYDDYDNSKCTFGNFETNNNNVQSYYDGIYIDFEYFGYETYENAKTTMGYMAVNNNTITVGDDDGIYLCYYEFGYDLADDEGLGASSFTMDDMVCNDNSITNTGGYGIYIEYIEEIGTYLYGDASCTIGNILFNRNTINTTDDYGMYFEDVYYLGYEMYDDATFEMGDFQINNNNITSTDYGIYAYYLGWFGEDLYDNSVFTMGNLQMNDNQITSESDGIDLYEVDCYGYYMTDYATATMGNIEINDNNITSGGYGIYISELCDMGYEIYDDASFTMGHTQINLNTIHSIYEGIYIDWIGDYGEDMTCNTVATFGDVQINNNLLIPIEAEPAPIGPVGSGMVLCIGCFGYDLSDYATVNMGQICAAYNNITSTYIGIYDAWSGEFGYELYNDSAYNGGSLVIAFNTITANSTGIDLGYQETDDLIVGGNLINAVHAGITAERGYLGCSNVTIAYNIINGTSGDAISLAAAQNCKIIANTLTNSLGAGINLTDSTMNVLVLRNIIMNNSMGFNVTDSWNNTIYDNNIITNLIQAFDDTGNAWNYSYPTGGNYWSDYNGTDVYRGPAQDIAGSDGIGDTPYPLYDGENQDYYPLMSEVTINHPSLYTPSNPSPSNGASHVSTTPTLSWDGGDPDHDYINYDVYFGTTSTPTYVDTIFLTNLTTNSWMPGTLVKGTTYYWKIIAWDNFNDTVSGPTWSFYTGTGGETGGEPPQNDHFVPTAVIGGPYYGIVNTAVHFDGSASHANKQYYTIQKYEWRFFDGDEWHDLGATPTYTYTTAGTYNVVLRVYDNDSYTGTDATTATISAGGNSAPSTPTIVGPKTLTSGSASTYSFTSTDPNNDQVHYYINWGDGTTITSDVTASGVAYQSTHTWATSGVYNITAYAKDSYDASSGTAKYTIFIGGISVPGQGFMIDENGDGVYDSYYNNATGHTSRVQQQADGTYLVDTNGDGTWDMVYNPASGTLSAYSPSIIGGTSIPLWSIGLVIVLIIVIIGIVLVLMRRKKPQQ